MVENRMVAHGRIVDESETIVSALQIEVFEKTLRGVNQHRQPVRTLAAMDQGGGPRGGGPTRSGSGAPMSLPDQPFLTPPAGTTLPPNNDYDLVSSTQSGGDWMQIHGRYPHTDMTPHTHVSEVNRSPSGVSRTRRVARETTSADINRADEELRSGEMWRRINRRDRGGSLFQ